MTGSKPAESAPADFVYVDSAARLAAVCEHLASVDRFGLDTEFVSERRYRPLLCLVQIVVGERIEILDPLGDLDPTPLAEVLADPAVEVVLHAGRQDVALLKRTWRCEIQNIFDTQVAAGFAGYGAQSGYDTLVRSLLGVSAKGAEGFSRWFFLIVGWPLTITSARYWSSLVARSRRAASWKSSGVSSMNRVQVSPGSNVGCERTF